MNARVSLLAAAIAVAAASVAGCASVVAGAPEQGAALSQPHFPKPSPSDAPATALPSSAAPTGFPSSSSSPSLPSLPPSTSEAPSSTGSSGGLPVINDVKFTRPSGFKKTDKLRLVDPLESHYQVEFMRPPGEPATGQDALAVVLYDLPAGRRPATASAQRAYIQRYNSAHQVSVTDGVQPKTIGGYPGYSVLADQPPNYHYFGYYVFGRNTLLSITCQYDLHPSAVYTACTRLLGSMRLSG
jgi:hypothetical protein